NYTFIVLAVYDLKLMHSSFLRRTIKNLFIRRFRILYIRGNPKIRFKIDAFMVTTLWDLKFMH
ncbi:unnamed protein product, partial [Rotaria magnacalcarata]